MDGATSERILSGCDASQREAITTDAAPLLVVAGAGSGKTRVLTRRIAWRALEQTMAAEHVVACTFTRKAAVELRTRLHGLGLPMSVRAGTFHALALSELRRLALDRSFAPPVVIDAPIRLIDKVAGRGTEQRRELLHSFEAEIAWAKARRVRPEDYVVAAHTGHRHVPGITSSRVSEVYEAYEREKRRRRVLDLDDLLEQLTFVLADDAVFAASSAWRIRHLFVDELQDANAAQLALLDAWLADRADLFAVGDARQAIYAWNGADPGAMSSFALRHPGARVIELESNYRSTPEIVAVAAAALPAGAPTPSTTRPAGRRPSFTAYDTSDDEARLVAAAARAANRRGRPWSRLAVLARTNAQLDAFVHAFDDAGVPRRAAHVDLLSRPDVRELVAPLLGSDSQELFRRFVVDLEAPADSEVGIGVALRQRLLGHALEYQALDPAPSGRGFVEFVRQIQRSEVDPDVDGVDLVTFHRAKGLEWSEVWVVGLEEGLVPIQMAVGDEAIDEERRLLHVALSRAIDSLHCSWARARTFGSRLQRRSVSPLVVELELAAGRFVDMPVASIDAARAALAASRAALSAAASSLVAPRP